ncbi:basic salivary proline-rich protein 2-like [Penaeus monodon]|uniref:basic salivary proline-rich protein 2-like n=1 Tax=Penaeus monodon TaxID=6687 RepID=UPI0018A7AEF0|nr:basic salivary proline-rich protein 2-like [Penaeus monodon]
MNSSKGPRAPQRPQNPTGEKAKAPRCFRAPAGSSRSATSGTTAPCAHANKPPLAPFTAHNAPGHPTAAWFPSTEPPPARRGLTAFPVGARGKPRGWGGPLFPACPEFSPPVPFLALGMHSMVPYLPQSLQHCGRDQNRPVLRVCLLYIDFQCWSSKKVNKEKRGPGPDHLSEPRGQPLPAPPSCATGQVSPRSRSPFFKRAHIPPAGGGPEKGVSKPPPRWCKRRLGCGHLPSYQGFVHRMSEAEGLRGALHPKKNSSPKRKHRLRFLEIKRSAKFTFRHRVQRLRGGDSPPE